MGTLIWLASYPKSGNTWVRSFLHNLVRDAETPADINALDEFCLGGSSRRWFEMVSTAPLEKLEPSALAKLRPQAQMRMAASVRNSIFVKSHNYYGPWFDVPLHNTAVTAGAVYILRNPLDVALSLAHHYGEPTDWAIELMSRPGAGTKLTARHVPEVYDTWSNHVLSWTAKENPKLLVLRFEDLLATPATTFGTLARFLGLKPDEEKLERAIRHSSFDILKSQEIESGFRERPQNAKSFFREGRAEQWRDALSPDQIRRVVADHHVQMARFGYIPEEYRDHVPAGGNR